MSEDNWTILILTAIATSFLWWCAIGHARDIWYKRGYRQARWDFKFLGKFDEYV